MPGDAPMLDARIRVDGVRGASSAAPRLDVDLHLGAGITAIMGPSGAGKSTLLATLAGLVRPTAGRIALGTEVFCDVARGVFQPPHLRRVALVFQSLALFPHLDVRENVAYGIRGAGMERAEARRAEAERWLARVHVQGLADRRPATLSGGEAQRVALARALASRPRLLLLDEPFSALDAGLRRELGETLRTLVADASLPTLLVTHDANDAERIARRTVQLAAGRERVDAADARMATSAPTHPEADEAR